MELVLSGLGSGSLGEGLLAPPTEGIRSHPLPHGFRPIWVTALVLCPHTGLVFYAIRCPMHFQLHSSQ